MTRCVVDAARITGMFYFSHVSRALKALLKDVQTNGTEIDEDDVEELVSSLTYLVVKKLAHLGSSLRRRKSSKTRLTKKTARIYQPKRCLLFTCSLYCS